jgi:hypothetical protein
MFMINKLLIRLRPECLRKEREIVDSQKFVITKVEPLNLIIVHLLGNEVERFEGASAKRSTSMASNREWPKAKMQVAPHACDDPGRSLPRIGYRQSQVSSR